MIIVDEKSKVTSMNQTLPFDARYFDPILENKAAAFLSETAEGYGSFKSIYNSELLARFAKLMLMEYWESQENNNQNDMAKPYTHIINDPKIGSVSV